MDIITESGAKIKDKEVQRVRESNWYGLYADSWQNEIVPDAFAHP